MKPILICVASKEEADLLLSPELDSINDCFQIITGFGFGSTLKALKEYAEDCTVINVGFVGVPEFMELHKLYNINISILGPNDNNINKPVVLKTIDSLPQVPCISVADFETDTARFYPNTCYTKDYVVDMELYMMANLFDSVYAFKIPSDTGNLKDYMNQSQFKKDLAQVRLQIYNVIMNIYNDLC